MEQIAKLLFATTFLSIFSYLLFFSSITHNGNGGEYWGYNGLVEPVEAAQVAYQNRDYRFLAVSFQFERMSAHEAPSEYELCENHPFGAVNSLRQSSTDPLHNSESTYLATIFATKYNEAMMDMLAEQMNYKCDTTYE